MRDLPKPSPDDAFARRFPELMEKAARRRCEEKIRQLTIGLSAAAAERIERVLESAEANFRAGLAAGNFTLPEHQQPGRVIEHEPQSQIAKPAIPKARKRASAPRLRVVTVTIPDGAS